MNYEPMAGESIGETAKNMVDMAAIHNCEVTASFNEIPLTASKDSSPGDIQQRYFDESEKRRKAYEDSPEYKQRQSEWAEKDRRKKELLAGALSVAGPMEFKDKDGWDKSLANNTDPYGACVFRYAEKWARLMQTRLANGETVAECAKETSHVADDEGITGFMYGCAVNALAHCWVHGEDLRRWHNLDTQIGSEGEKANESGAVLNPAVLSIG